ncbi:MAG: aminoacetone oxidase family FAD-binding enzyme [Bacteroidales bacterium]|nr:aminoacetone oxidase family FAD-binding enzyme [Bacteroidales bacterium]
MGKVYDIVIIGGGAAGLYAAATLSSLNMEGASLKVLLLEKMHRCGLKIGITGKGRCNLTNTKPWEEFSSHIHPKNIFLKNSFYGMSNLSTMEFFEKIGLPLVVERGDRVFPQSMKATDVPSVLEKHILRGGVEIKKNAPVRQIKSSPDNLFLVEYGEGEELASRKIIVATGGLSYKTTGSTGDGYEFAKSFGHKITQCFPSLTALRPKDYREEFQGISLKNVSLQLVVNGNVVQEEFGDLDFTNGGIEGPIGFKVSRKGVHSIINGQKVEVVLDMKPAVSHKQLRERISRELLQVKGNQLKGLLPKLLPQSIVPLFVAAHKNLSIENLPEKLKCWKFAVEGYVGYERCVVTAGGVHLQEVSQKSMESKLVKGLYFAGEVLDLDGDTGGYNLQIAFSTGALAAMSAAKSTR